MKVLITGATSGIGLALTELYARKDNQVIACGRNEQKLVQLEKSHPSVSTVQFDITDSNAVKTVAQRLEQDIDIVILNAGDCEYIDEPMQFDGELFERIINTNLISVGHCLQYWLPKIKPGGCIVFIGSSATLQPFPRAEAYGASKAGLKYLANALRISLSKHNIQVTLVEPGFVKTPLTDKNTFDMPFMVSPQRAAKEIIQGIEAGKPLIQFPKRLIWLLKMFSFLPQGVWQSLMNKGNN